MPLFRQNRFKSLLSLFSRTPRAPGVYVEEVSSAIRPISGVSTSVTAFIGWSPIGPTSEAIRVASFQDYQAAFGGLHAESPLSYSVWQFFQNGGKDTRVLRLADSDDNPLHPNDSGFESKLLPASGSGGVYLLDRLDLFNLVCVPGETNASVIAQLQAFCHDRRAFLIVDGPESTAPATMQSLPESAITGANSKNSALYYPWLMVADPLDDHRPRAFPPCGFVAGIYARTDTQRGVWKAPAGMATSLIGALGTQYALDDGDIRQLNPRGINCIRQLPDSSTLVWGSRTLSATNLEWVYVPVRRLALFLEESISRGTQWAAFEPNDQTLWSNLRVNVETFMNSMYRQGAFQGAQSKDAYFVRCDASTTTTTDVAAGVVNVLVGFAPLKPAEFVVLRLVIKQR